MQKFGFYEVITPFLITNPKKFLTIVKNLLHVKRKTINRPNKNHRHIKITNYTLGLGGRFAKESNFGSKTRRFWLSQPMKYQDLPTPPAAAQKESNEWRTSI